MIRSNCEEERGHMHGWVTDQACCMSEQLKNTEHIYIYFFFLQSCCSLLELHLGGCFSFSPVVQWSLCLHRDGHQVSLKSQYNSSLCPMDWATLWVSFTYVYILMHGFRCALKCAFKPRKEAETAQWICSITSVMVLKLDFFLKFLSPVCCPIHFISQTNWSL